MWGIGPALYDPIGVVVLILLDSPTISHLKYHLFKSKYRNSALRDTADFTGHSPDLGKSFTGRKYYYVLRSTTFTGIGLPVGLLYR